VGEVAFGGWQQIDARRVVALKDHVDRSRRTPMVTPGVGSSQWRADVKEYGSYYQRLYAGALAVSGAQLAIDSSKQASLPHVLLQQPIDLATLHCVRDSRAVAYSWMQKVKRPEARDANSLFMHQYSPATLATKWMIHNAVIEGLSLRRARSLRLRYEDWVADPIGSVRRVLEFAGLPDDAEPQRIGETWVDLDQAHTCSGNPMRFTVGRVDIRRDERWQQGLSRRDRALVTAITLPFLVRYHYVDTPWSSR
jgi:hypothetical protein